MRRSAIVDNRKIQAKLNRAFIYIHVVQYTRLFVTNILDPATFRTSIMQLATTISLAVLFTAATAMAPDNNSSDISHSLLVCQQSLNVSNNPITNSHDIAASLSYDWYFNTYPGPNCGAQKRIFKGNGPHGCTTINPALSWVGGACVGSLNVRFHPQDHCNGINIDIMTSTTEMGTCFKLDSAIRAFQVLRYELGLKSTFLLENSLGVYPL